MQRKLVASCTAALIFVGSCLTPVTMAVASPGESGAPPLSKEASTQGLPLEAPREPAIKRLQFLSQLATALGIQPLFPSKASFADVSPGSLDGGAVEALNCLGLLSNLSPDRLGASEPMTRQDAALLLWRALGDSQELYPGDPFTDEEEIAEDARSAARFAAGKGWLAAGDGRFRPQDGVTLSETERLMEALRQFRKYQAMQAVAVTSKRQVGLRPDETKAVEVPPGAPAQWTPGNGGAIGFTPVFGIDDLKLGRLSGDDGFTLGPQAPQGLVTVNAGLAAYPLEVDAYNASKVKTASPADQKDAPALSAPIANTEYTVQISQHGPDLAFQQQETKLYPGPKAGLASPEETWTGFLRQEGRDVLIDLQRLRPVTGVSLEFQQNLQLGILMPPYLQGAISPDGVNWYYLGEVRHRLSPSDAKAQQRILALRFPAVNARYIKLSFPVDNWAFARRLTVESAPAATKPVVLSRDERVVKSADNTLQIPGVNDILLIYTGNYGKAGTWTSDEFLPMVAYRKDQRLQGRMFDTMLFLPYEETGSVKDKWSAYLEDLFAPGVQLSALNDAVAQMNNVLGTTEKEKVILTLPYPNSREHNFGSLEKKGPVLSFDAAQVGREQALANRLAAQKWYYGELVNRWNAAKFDHLELAGIYWYAETIDANIPDETELVQGAARLVRADKRDFYWIPFYGANGYENWRSYGFEYVLLQPNYYAEDSKPDERMDRTAALTRKYRLGMELEISDQIFYSPSHYDTFYKQLNKAHQLGADGSMTNAYYAASKTLVRVCNSSDPKIRAIYDDLYRWMRGNYRPK
ncbi:DUF4855 domain-containing protein [Heliobacterium gestii]|uniref:DUF4855 domain-containing protein n=1 Tax=Heliomicrobium gestii TaxID=2699 RepID=A0A845LLG9_HELGE|nr:DUF4855 domain-containing protein [Heliomicrobium gestii]MBM7867432.1 hypothetical protein [Heliomicrobium gestii]MZP43696.1 DUF4855 domain-containing protein [Heliomicrobium gestii]